MFFFRFTPREIPKRVLKGCRERLADAVTPTQRPWNLKLLSSSFPGSSKPDYLKKYKLLRPFLFFSFNLVVVCGVASPHPHPSLFLRLPFNREPFPSQGIFPTQRSNPGLQHCRQVDSLRSEPPGKPRIECHPPLDFQEAFQTAFNLKASLTWHSKRRPPSFLILFLFLCPCLNPIVKLGSASLLALSAHSVLHSSRSRTQFSAFN